MRVQELRTLYQRPTGLPMAGVVFLLGGVNSRYV